MDIAVAILTTAALIVVALTSFGSGEDTPTWELRWRGLAPADRARISVAARSHETLTDPEEAELAEGLRRRDRRREGYAQMVLLAFPVAATILSLTGVVDGGVAGLILAVAGIAGGAWAYLRGRYMDGTPRSATAPDAGL